MHIHRYKGITKHIFIFYLIAIILDLLIRLINLDFNNLDKISLNKEIHPKDF